MRQGSLSTQLQFDQNCEGGLELSEINCEPALALTVRAQTEWNTVTEWSGKIV